MDKSKLYADLTALIDDDLKNKKVAFLDVDYRPTEVRLLAHAMTNNVAEPEKSFDFETMVTRIKEVLALPPEMISAGPIPVPREIIEALKRDLQAETVAIGCLNWNRLRDAYLHWNRLRDAYLHPLPLDILIQDECRRIKSKKRRVVQPVHPPKQHGSAKWPSAETKRRRRRK